MPTRFLSDAELAQLAGFPTEVAAEDLVTYFDLEADDRRWLITGHRGEANRLGLALQLCSLRWLGFVPDDLTTAPAPAVDRLARPRSRRWRTSGPSGPWSTTRRACWCDWPVITCGPGRWSARVSNVFNAG